MRTYLYNMYRALMSMGPLLGTIDQNPKFTFDEDMTMLDVTSVREQLVELSALARKEHIDEFEFKWVPRANFKTDIEGAQHLEQFIKAMSFPTDWETGTPYKVNIVYNHNTIKVTYIDDFHVRIKLCPILRTWILYRLKNQVDTMMDNLKILGVVDIDLTWDTRERKILVNSMTLDTDDIYTEARTLQAHAILDGALDSNWPDNFPEKVNITMSQNSIHLTAIVYTR